MQKRIVCPWGSKKVDLSNHNKWRMGMRKCGSLKKSMNVAKSHLLWPISTDWTEDCWHSEPEGWSREGRCTVPLLRYTTQPTKQAINRFNFCGCCIKTSYFATSHKWKSYLYRISDVLHSNFLRSKKLWSATTTTTLFAKLVIRILKASPNHG